MTTLDLKEMLGDFINTKAVVEVRKIQTFNMYNTDHLMWIDLTTMVFHFDEFRTDWVQ
jgi:hypothetical protein